MDSSLRGRLISLVDKIKSLRKKEEEEKPEVEEEAKLSKSNSQITCSILTAIFSPNIEK